MCPDWSAVRAAAETGGSTLPPDGIHLAQLQAIKLYEPTDQLITDWATVREPYYFWSSWNGWDGQRLAYTLELLSGIGLNMAAVDVGDDEKFDELARPLLGRTYIVRTVQRSGNTGRVFINTTIEQRSPEQPSLDDVPIDTDGLPEPTPASDAPALPAGETIPF